MEEVGSMHLNLFFWPSLPLPMFVVEAYPHDITMIVSSIPPEMCDWIWSPSGTAPLLFMYWYAPLQKDRYLPLPIITAPHLSFSLSLSPAIALLWGLLLRNTGIFAVPPTFQALCRVSDRCRNNQGKFSIDFA